MNDASQFDTWPLHTKDRHSKNDTIIFIIIFIKNNDTKIVVLCATFQQVYDLAF